MSAQRFGSRLLAASSTRQASRSSVSYPMASSASPTTGSPAALCATQASTVVKAASSAARSPAGAGGSTLGSSSPASTPRALARLATGGTSAAFGFGGSSSHAASAKRSAAAIAFTAGPYTLLPSERMRSMTAEQPMEDPKKKQDDAQVKGK